VQRREFLRALGGAAAFALPRAGSAQQPVKMLRVGTVSGQPRSTTFWLAFEQRMAELGYEEGKNFAFDHRQAQSLEEFETGYRDLAARNSDIIVASGSEVSLRSALASTSTIPIVMIAIDYDPLGRGYVTSLGRPTGRVTGLFFQQIELTVKRVQLFKNAYPDMQAATVFWDSISVDQWEAARNAGATLGLRLTGIELRDQPYDYDRALLQAAPEYRRAVFVLASPFLFRDRIRLGDFALRNRVLSMFVFREWVEAGGLFSYGPSITGMYRRAAEYVDRIARGAQPADLPIEQSAKFELVINLKTAKALGIDVPPILLARADDVIE
jgi:putative tryptophan/tyrosine transport system substrate-binding protein